MSIARAAVAAVVLLCVSAAAARVAVAAPRSVYRGAAVRFSYPSHFERQLVPGAGGSAIKVNAPDSSLIVSVSEVYTTSSPTVMRARSERLLRETFGAQGLVGPPSREVARDFAVGPLRGVRFFLDNVDDWYVFEVYAWRQGDVVVVVNLQYKRNEGPEVLPVVDAIVASMR